jgi:hypothetical protein
MEFTIGKKVVRVPTDFVVLNGTSYDWTEFYQIIEILHRFAKGPLDRRDLNLNLNRDFVVEWEKQGVLTSYNEFHTGDYGDQHTYEMLKKGPSYAKFFAAFRTFETKLQLERQEADRAARHTSLKKQLKDLDVVPSHYRPALKNIRSKALKNDRALLEDL